MRAPLIAHIHLPKTAGTSFRSMLENRFGPDHANLYVDDTFFVYPESEIEAFVAGRPGLRSLSSHFIRTYPPRIAGREVLYVTFLRKPVEQFISYLTYTKKHHAKIPDQALLQSLPERASELPLREIARWVLTHPGVPFHENYLVNYFAQCQYVKLGGSAEDRHYAQHRLAITKDVLASFFLTGITERMDESVRRFQVLGERYGIQLPGEVQVENVSRDFRDDLRWVHADDEVGAMLLASIAEDQKLYDWALERFEQSASPAKTMAPASGSERPKTLSFVTQLFWRVDGVPFSEEKSVLRNWAVGPKGGRYRMRLPRFEAAPAQLRLDLTDRPAVLRVNSISLVNDRAEPLWSLDLKNARTLAMTGMTIATADTGDGAVVKIETNDPMLLLPLHRSVLKRLKSGATLEIEMGTGAEVNVNGHSSIPLPPSPAVSVPFTATTGPRLYLELLERCLTRLLIPDSCVDEQLEPTGFFYPEARLEGKDWPSEAETMIGLKRLESLEACAAAVLNENVPGDFVEAGVWRGGASILLRAVLRAYGDAERRVWLADSFEGLPAPNVKQYPADKGKPLHVFNEYLAVSVETVKRNFEKYGLLDDRVCFLKGWFKDSLPNAPIRRISLLRLDGDLYESTMDVLRNLYDRVSPAGYVIVDDYGVLESCKAAIHDFRKERGITEPIVPIDWSGVYWRKRPD